MKKTIDKITSLGIFIDVEDKMDQESLNAIDQFFAKDERFTAVSTPVPSSKNPRNFIMKSKYGTQIDVAVLYNSGSKALNVSLDVVRQKLTCTIGSFHPKQFVLFKNLLNRELYR